MQTPNPMSEVRARSLFAPIAATITGARVLFHGSSILHGDDNLGGNTGNFNSPPTHAMLHSDGRWRHVGNTSVDGSTSTAQLASLEAALIAYRPDVVVLDPIPNDASSSFTTATTAANVAAMVKLCARYGAKVIICNGAPNATKLEQISRLNAWLERYCARNGIVMVDWHGLLVDPATGGWRSGEDFGDGVHPSYKMRQPMGFAIDNALRRIVPAGRAPLFDHKADPNDIMGGSGFFLGALNGSGESGLTDGWSAFSGFQAAGAGTWTAVTDPLIKGKAMRATGTGGTATAQIYKEYTTGFSVGDTVELSGILNIPDASGGMGPEAFLRSMNASNATIADIYALRVVAQLPSAIDHGVWSREYVIPAGCTKLHVRLKMSTDGSKGNIFQTEYAQVGIRNLTTGGLVGV